MNAFSAENCRNLQEKPKLFLFQVKLQIYFYF